MRMTSNWHALLVWFIAISFASAYAYEVGDRLYRVENTNFEIRSLRSETEILKVENDALRGESVISQFTLMKLRSEYKLLREMMNRLQRENAGLWFETQWNKSKGNKK